jgi:histone-lysine N-methyltransferase SETMAR
VLLHDNARKHTVARTRALLEDFNWELSDHPPYSPDLAPSDYRLFLYVKDWFGSHRLNNNYELMEGEQTWLSSQAADFFNSGVQNLIPRYTRKCVNSGGHCVEKRLKYVGIFCT